MAWTILYVEDDALDVDLARSALKVICGEHKVDLRVCENGEEALNAISVIKTLEAPIPSLILLDLNLPRIGGWDVLSAIRQSAHLSGVPVVVLSTLCSDTEVERLLKHGANDFFTKPLTFSGYIEMFTKIYKGYLNRSERCETT